MWKISINDIILWVWSCLGKLKVGLVCIKCEVVKSFF